MEEKKIKKTKLNNENIITKQKDQEKPDLVETHNLNNIEKTIKRKKKLVEKTENNLNENINMENNETIKKIEKFKIKEEEVKEESKMIAYIKNMKAYYYVSLLETGIKNEYIEEKNTNSETKLKDTFFIPFNKCGEISDSLAFFDNFKFSKFGKIKKLIYIIMAFASVMSIYYFPEAIFYYAVIYIILFSMYLFYVKNKHYIRLDVLTNDDEVLKIVYLFDIHNEKLFFFNEVKNKNIKLLSIKNNLNQIYKSNFLKRIFNK